jgi:hypothetical protein
MGEGYGPTAWIHPGVPITIVHAKPWKRDVFTRGTVESFRDGLLTIRRAFRGGGTYDSLDVPKRDGDWGRIEIVPRGTVLRRTYYRRHGALIGELYNIQTPVELRPGQAVYTDLEVDVVRRPNGAVTIVDLDDLDELERSGYFPQAILDGARAVATRLAEVLRQGGSWREVASIPLQPPEA